MSFKLLELTPIGKGGLLGRARLEMPSGLAILCNIFRSRKDPTKIFAAPVSERQSGGNYVEIVSFKSPQQRAQWTELAFKAIEPRIPELLAAAANTAAPAPKSWEEVNDDCPF